MKVLKKVNLGLALTIIAILAVVIYSVKLESDRKNAKDDIKKACESFIETTNKYCMLPEDKRVVGQSFNDVNLDSYYDEMKKDIRNHVTSDKTADIQKSILEQNIKAQMINTNSIATKYNKKIEKIESYVFDGNQVTVTFNSKVSVSHKYNDINLETGEISEKVREEELSKEGESIVLEQVDGVWKVVSANLDYSTSGDANYNMNLLGM